MISAGRVLLMPKGDYDSNTTYEMLDIVSYNGSSYIAKGTTTGNLPTNTTYWQLSAYGGQASNLAGNFAPLETTDYATRAYSIDEIFVDKDSQLVIATDAINIGDEIEIGSNCEITSIADLLDDIKNYYDALDQRNRKLIGITQLTAQTDLHLLVPGEYYKKLTNFYVTNGPTGVNQVPTAVFRLTVESGLDENSSSVLLTLRATDGKVYTQSYDGTSWSAWVEVASKAYVDNQISNLGTAASKDSTNAVTEDSTDLVESGAVYTGLSAKANSADLGTAASKDSTNAVTSGSTDLVESGAVFNKVDAIENDLTNIKIVGTTNDTGATIYGGTFFYKDGVLVKAIANIASGATLTANTNYKEVTAGVLNEENPYNLSTTERVVGHTSDGKTLYQKTLTGYSTTYTDSTSRRTFNIDIASALGGAKSIRSKTGWVKSTHPTGYVITDVGTATAESDLNMQLWCGTVITSTVPFLFFGYATSYSGGVTRVDYDVTFTYTKD